VYIGAFLDVAGCHEVVLPASCDPQPSRLERRSQVDAGFAQYIMLTEESVFPRSAHLLPSPHHSHRTMALRPPKA